MMKEQHDQPTKFAVLFPQQKLSIAAVTWNLYGNVPPDRAIDQMFKFNNMEDASDLIVIGTQECQRSLFASFCFESKEVWEEKLCQRCPNHFLAITQTMRGLHIAVMLKRSLQDYFQSERKQKMRAGGICNMMGNKGAISVQFSLLGQHFQIINCHLAPHQHECSLRNQQINRVQAELIRKDGEIIFLGDFNYRIEMDKLQYKGMIAGRSNTQADMKYSQFVGRDQLNGQQELKNNFLQKFEEGTIKFPPTYKMGVNTGEYCRQRIPGWTDRIFHRRGGRLQRKSYSCAYENMGSDHRPVFAFFESSIEEQALSLASENYIGVKSGTCQLI